MSTRQESSDFTQAGGPQSFGPPLIGALLRVPWEHVLRRMLARLCRLVVRIDVAAVAASRRAPTGDGTTETPSRRTFRLV